MLYKNLLKFNNYDKSYFLLKRFIYAINDSDINYFKNILGHNNVKTEDIESYNEDWLKMHRGKSQMVLLPNSTKQVSSILSYCSSKLIRCVVQGGNTSLVAGAVPYNDEVIVSMSKLNKIESFNETTGILRCESGCILEKLEEYVNDHGYMMPFDLGAKGSCQIGGNLSTNAGGVRYIKYGSLHGSVLGIEVVLADGTVLDLMSDMRKDNTGYDLKHLFIGAEGTLGMITKVAIMCPIKPTCQTVGVFSLTSFDNLLKCFYYFKKELNEYISSFEMMDSVSIDAVINNLNLSFPLSKKQPFYMLVELSSDNGDEVENKLAQVLEKLMDDQIIIDGTFSSDMSNTKKLWAFRERIAEALLKDGFSYKYDISVPLEIFYDIVEIMRKRLDKTPCLKVCGYGHMGDSNLHLNMTSKTFDKDILKLIEPFVYEYVSEKKGSISAEHGLGLKKRNFLHYSKSPEAISLMMQLKKLLDPNGILNPGKVLPD